MATIERESIRATITIGNTEISTPDVVSFNVKRARGQMAATFSATIKVDGDFLTSSLSAVGNGVSIKAGVKGRERQIFTGVVKKCTVNPMRNDASKVMLSIAGSDRMSIMEGQKINRRVVTYRDGTTPPARWGVVTALLVDNNPIKSGFKQKEVSAIQTAAYSFDKLPITVIPLAYGLNRSYGDTYGSIAAELVDED